MDFIKQCWNHCPLVHLDTHRFQAKEGTTFTVFKVLTRKSRPKSGIDCLMRAEFARQRTMKNASVSWLGKKGAAYPLGFMGVGFGNEG